MKTFFFEDEFFIKTNEKITIAYKIEYYSENEETDRKNRIDILNIKTDYMSIDFVKMNQCQIDLVVQLICKLFCISFKDLLQMINLCFMDNADHPVDNLPQAQWCRDDKTNLWY